MRLVALVLAVVAHTNVSHAACVNSSSASCNWGGTDDVCILDTVFAPDDQVYCDLGVNGIGSPPDVHAITNGGDIEVFGTDGAGNTFCCELTPDPTAPMHYVTVKGSNNSAPGYEDTVTLWYSVYNLSETSGGPDLRASVVGHQGDDTITGSKSTSTKYEEWLQGAEGDDTISGLAGDDILDGGGGADTLKGGGGDDELIGGEGRDTLEGGDGNEDLYGDLKAGSYQPALDTLKGGDGHDLLCSGGVHLYDSGEHMEGGPGDDELWGGFGTLATGLKARSVATDEGDLGTDDCDDNPYVRAGAGMPASCENPITADPGCY